MLDMNKIGLFNYLTQEERKKRKREIDERIVSLRKAIDNAGGADNFVENHKYRGIDIQINFPFSLTKEEEIYFRSHFKDLNEVIENI